MKYAATFAASLLAITSFSLSLTADNQELVSSSSENQPEVATEAPTPIAPARSLATGLLLEPDLDLDWFTREKFVAMVSNVGEHKIGKPWTEPVVKLPPHSRSDAKGLTTDEIQEYMLTVRDLFDQGKAIPVSDTGLISTQEDVIRKPMLNHISAFENDVVRIFLLVQRTSTDEGWGYYSILQDMTVNPPQDHYANIRETDVKFEGTSCYKCHSSGPLAIHPAREDLVLDAQLAAALSEYIAQQPRSEFHFPKDSPRPKLGKPMQLEACTACHEADGDRGPLYQVHSHPIRIMVDYGYMPPGERLSAEEIAQLNTWLGDKEASE